MLPIHAPRVRDPDSTWGQAHGGYTYARTHTIKDAANPQNVDKQFDTDTPEHLFKLTTSYHFLEQRGRDLERPLPAGNIKTATGEISSTPTFNDARFTRQVKIPD